MTMFCFRCPKIMYSNRKMWKREGRKGKGGEEKGREGRKREARKRDARDESENFLGTL